MAEVDTRCAERKKPEEKPVQQPWEEALDWDAYYKNRGLISTRLGVKKSEYLQCSTKPDKKDPKKAPPSCCSSCPVQDRATVYIADCPTPKKKGKPNKEYMRCFAANMVVQRLDMPGWEFECPEKLTLKAEIAPGCKLCLDMTRFNLNCLPMEVLKEFQMEAECLARQLSEGVCITLCYMKKEIGE